jgi:hypothetical protein
MARRSTFLPIALLTALSVGCGLLPQQAAHPPLPETAERSSVGVIAEGSAFARPGVTEGVVRLLEYKTGRRVFLFSPPPASTDLQWQTTAAALLKANPSLARYDWHEPHCTAYWAVLPALEHDVDAVYRVSLDYSEASRPLVEPDPTPRTGIEQFLHALDVGSHGSERRESVSGRVALFSFGASPESPSIPIDRTVTYVEPTMLAPRLDIASAVGEAIGQLGAVRAPDWDGFGRWLLSSECPLLALGVSEARLDHGPAQRKLKTEAVATMQRGLTAGPVRQLAQDTSARMHAALEAGNLKDAEVLLEQYDHHPAHQAHTAALLRRRLESARRRAAADQKRAAVDRQAKEDRYSCQVLCGLHMVELCNNDKVLWNRSGRTWEASPCGQRRAEPFLVECYRQQWLTGTFHDSCLLPCESAADGRDKLMRILQGAGCIGQSS